MSTLKELRLDSTPSKEQLELLQNKEFTLSNEDISELTEVDLMELVYLAYLAKGYYSVNQLEMSKEQYLFFLAYFDSENWKMDKKWLNWRNQNQREIKIAMGLKCREFVSKYKSYTVESLVKWIDTDKDDIIGILKEWLTVFVINAVQDVYMIDLELQMQDMAKKVPPNTPVDPSPINLIQSGPLLNQQGKLLRPFTLLSKNQRDIFKPFHSLPTMTIDEYIDEEIERGGILLNKPDSVIDMKDLGYALDEDQDWEEIEKKRLKDINWDAFKDDNPRGHGNRIGKG